MIKYPLLIKGSLMGLLFSAVAFSANAQKIEDQELKINVSKIANSTQHLINLEPVTFQYDVKKFKNLSLPSTNQYGFLTRSVSAEFPSLVVEKSTQVNAGKNASKVASYDEVKTAELIPVLVAAIKEQQAEIELLKKEIGLLKRTAK